MLGCWAESTNLTDGTAVSLRPRGPDSTFTFRVLDTRIAWLRVTVGPRVDFPGFPTWREPSVTLDGAACRWQVVGMAAADAPQVPSTVATAEGADAPSSVEPKPPEPVTQAPAAEREAAGEDGEANGEDGSVCSVLLVPEGSESGQPVNTEGAEGVQKRQRAKKVLNPRWTAEMDEKLAAAVKEYGDAQWSKVAEQLEGRSGKQCRERWKNHVCSEVKQGDWSPEEDARLVAVVGEVCTRLGRLEHCRGGFDRTPLITMVLHQRCPALL